MLQERRRVGIDVGTGWVPDLPDFRDYNTESDSVGLRPRSLGQKDSVKAMIKKAGLTDCQKVRLPPSVDLRKACPPIEHQGPLQSCSAHAGVALVEYYEKRSFGSFTDASRLFLYKTTRKLTKSIGDSGASLRTTMSALALFGVPPERYWPYVLEDYNKEPPAFCYALAQNYQAVQYFRLDPPGKDSGLVLKAVQAHLAAGMPSMFGFSVYTCIDQSWIDGLIPYPTDKDRRQYGHGMVAVGYDDKIEIANESAAEPTVGALLIRNSWGVDWGDDGYGWLPYEYLLKGLARDWWTLLKNEWIDTQQFGL